MCHSSYFQPESPCLVNKILSVLSIVTTPSLPRGFSTKFEALSVIENWIYLIIERLGTSYGMKRFTSFLLLPRFSTRDEMTDSCQEKSKTSKKLNISKQLRVVWRLSTSFRRETLSPRRNLVDAERNQFCEFGVLQHPRESSLCPGILISSYLPSYMNTYRVMYVVT